MDRSSAQGAEKASVSMVATAQPWESGSSDRGTKRQNEDAQGPKDGMSAARSVAGDMMNKPFGTRIPSLET